MAMGAMMRVALMDIGAEHHRSTIHSGHYMMSCLDETSDDTDYYGYATAASEGVRRPRSTFRQKVDGGGSSNDVSCLIESNLAELLRYMTLTYNGTLPSPKWKDFKGIKLKLRQKIRLNNIIWREWHMQYIKFKNPVLCQFDVPTSDRTHNRPEAVVLEGKYSKRRLESLAVEYSRWRIYAKQKLQMVKNEERELMQKKLLLDNLQLDSIVSLMQSLSDDPASLESTPKKLDFSGDRLFASFSQPFAFPCVREIVAEARNYFNTEIMVQPCLTQLQPNLPDKYTSYELKPGTPLVSQKVTRRNPILSYLLTGTATSSASELFANKPQSLFDTGSLSLPCKNSDREQTTSTESTNLFLPINEMNASFNEFSSKDSNMADDIDYLQNSSMNFVQQNLEPDVSALSFDSSRFPGSSLPLPPSDHGSANQSNHLRALLQSNENYRGKPTESGAVGFVDNDSSAFPLPTKRRKSTGQPAYGPSSAQVSNKSLQKLINGEGKDRSIRRASTGTLAPSVGLSVVSNTAVFTAPQKKVQKLKSHSVGSHPVQEGYQATVRRRKTSCVSRGSFVFNYDEDTGVLMESNNGRGGLRSLGSPYATGSPIHGSSCLPPSSTAAIEPHSFWDVPVTPQSMETTGNCPFDNDVFDCEMGVSDTASIMSTQQINSAVVNTERTSVSIPTSMTTIYGQTRSSEDFPTNNDELTDLDTKPEQDFQQMQSIEQRRAIHLSSEQKRRVTINNGFEKLDELIRSSGNKPSSKSSKSATLNKSALLIRNLQKEKLSLQNEAEKLKKEIQILQDGLNMLQSNLPVTGCLPAVRPKTEVMFELYDNYVRTRTQANWKFWIFAQLMRPIYSNYIQSLSSVVVSNLCQAVKFWLEQHCSLTILRPAFSNELREICRKTSIINDPSKLPQEAHLAANFDTK